MSLEKTAEAIGVSSGWACQLRSRFIKEGKVIEIDKPLRGGRRRENITIEEEKELTRAAQEESEHPPPTSCS